MGLVLTKNLLQARSFGLIWTLLAIISSAHHWLWFTTCPNVGHLNHLPTYQSFWLFQPRPLDVTAPFTVSFQWTLNPWHLPCWANNGLSSQYTFSFYFVKGFLNISQSGLKLAVLPRQASNSQSFCPILLGSLQWKPCILLRENPCISWNCQILF